MAFIIRLSTWEAQVNIPMRAEARKIAKDEYPDLKVPYLWGEGTDVEHWVDNYKEHPSYAREYLLQLRIIRARRF